YFQYNPLRMIFPSLFFLLAYAYFGTKSLKLYYFIPVMLALGILWNPDIGMVCMVSWFAVLSYIEVLKITSEKKTIKESAK
ncbi:hypothetical protein L6260_01415, partial [Candidatus Parcubacteria bacterium]|nr:hypothetical protein [Candidatus Parcubacteria bacterium]